MSNTALGAGSDLDGHHDALSTKGGVYIQVVPLGQPYMGYHCPLSVLNVAPWWMEGCPDEIAFCVSRRQQLDLQLSTYVWNWN